MGFVIKTIRQEVGESSEEVCYHFEVFEDFMAFEKQEKVSVVNEKMIDTPPVEESECATHCDDNARCVTEIIKGVKYRIKNYDVTGHDFNVGEVVTAAEDSDDLGNALCETEKEGWYVNVSEVELID